MVERQQKTIRVRGAGTVLITKSARRKKTIAVTRSDGRLEAVIPKHMCWAEAVPPIRELIEEISEMMERSGVTSDQALARRASVLARRYRLREPREINWVSGASSYWGLCVPASETITLNDQLKDMPSWVIDYVLVHELAHLTHTAHSPAFWALTRRYPKTDQAIGYLMAKAEVPVCGLS